MIKIKIENIINIGKKFDAQETLTKGKNSVLFNVDTNEQEEESQENYDVPDVWGWDIDNPEMPVNLVEQIRDGYYALDDEGNVVTEHTLDAILRKKTGKGKGKGKGRDTKVCFKC